VVGVGNTLFEEMDIFGGWVGYNCFGRFLKRPEKWNPVRNISIL
jgi:hypothetical protein